MKYIVFPLFVLVLGYVFFGSDISIDNRNALNSPVLFKSPNSIVNYSDGNDELLREYGYVAFLNAVGGTVYTGRSFTNNGELLKGTYEERDDQLQFKCDENSLNIYKEVIKDEPKFPFSYFALGTCLKDNGKSGWEGYLIEAVRIFEMTTQIEGHKKEHDEALKILQEDIKGIQ